MVQVNMKTLFRL